MPLERVKNNKPPTEDEIKGRLIFGPIMIVIGTLILLFASYPKYKLAKETNSWIQTEGKITDVEIVAHKKGFQCLGKNLDLHDMDDEVDFRVDVRYQYLVDTTWHTSSKIHLLQNKQEGNKSLRKAKRKANFYIEHPIVMVHYNPDNPEEALLRTGLKFGQWLLIFSPILMLIAGFPLTIGAIRHKLNPQKIQHKPVNSSFSDNFSDKI